MFLGCLAGCPLFVITYFALHDISLLNSMILMKLGTNIHHVSGRCCKLYQGQRSMSNCIIV